MPLPKNTPIEVAAWLKNSQLSEAEIEALREVRLPDFSLRELSAQDVPLPLRGLRVMADAILDGIVFYDDAPPKQYLEVALFIVTTIKDEFSQAECDIRAALAQ